MVKNNQGGRSGNRGRGGGRYYNNRSGRGRGNSRSPQEGSNRTELKFAPQNPNKPTATFATVLDYVANLAQTKYTEYGFDIAQSLRELKKIDLSTKAPTRKVSQLTVQGDKEAEQAGFDIDYRIEKEGHVDRCRALENNLTNAYAWIYQTKCTDTMQKRIDQHPDFESKIQNDPIELLKAIKVLTHDPVRARYPIASFVQAQHNWLNARMSSKEHPLDWLKRFKQHRDVYTNHAGKNLLDTFTEQSADYTALTGSGAAAAQQKMKDLAFKEYCAFLYCFHSDQERYGSLLKYWASQYSMGNNQYPKTLTAAVEILGNHKPDNHNKQRNPPSNDDADGANEGSKASSFNQVTQSRGKGKGKGKQGGGKDKQRDIFCYCCGDPNHIVPDCNKKKKIPRDEWYVNQAITAFENADSEEESDASDQAESSDDDQSVRSQESSRSTRSNSSRHSVCRSGPNRSNQSRNRHRGFDGLQLNFKQSTKPYSKLQDVIILDTGSTPKGTFMNPDFIKNVRPSKKILDMHTNAGNKLLTLEADLPGYDSVYYDPSHIANILGFAPMAAKHRITYDNAKEDAFLVHRPNGIMKFTKTKEGLYAYKPSAEFIKENLEAKGMCHMIDTVESNKQGFTKRELAQAKLVRTIMRRLGFATVASMKHLIVSNFVKNLPITVEDCDRAEQIYGPDASSLKGKSTRKRPEQVRPDYIELPQELLMHHKKISLCIDTMFVSGVGFLSGIDRSIKHRFAQPIDNRSAEEYYRVLDKAFRFWNSGGFFIGTIYCDIEFKPLIDPIKDYLDVEVNYTEEKGEDDNIHINYASANEHVPEAERNIRTICDRIRATYHSLPYKAIPKQMIRYLGMICAEQLNYFPAKGGISSYYSPYTILTKRQLDYKKDLQFSFGSYVLSEDPTTNDQKARKIEAIYLRPHKNFQEGHEVLNLNTGMVINRRDLKVQPVTPHVIKMVETMAESQGIKSLKFKNRHGIVFHPANWIAGVDYTDKNPTAEEVEDAADNDYDINEAPEPPDDDFNDDDFEPIDSIEVEELLAERESNPIVENVTTDDDNSSQEQSSEGATDDEVDSHGTATRTSTRVRTQPTRLQPTFRGQSYAQKLEPIEEEPWYTSTNLPAVEDTFTPKRKRKATFAEVEEPANNAKAPWFPKQYRKSSRTNKHKQVYDTPRQRAFEKKKQVAFTQKQLEQMEYCHNFITQTKPDIEYTVEEAIVIARTIGELESKIHVNATSFAEQYLLNQGLKKFGDRGAEATTKELKQLLQRNCFTPITLNNMSAEDKRKAQQALLFLTQKRSGEVKGRLVFDGKPTREWLSREDSASPTASTESICLTAVIEAKEKRDTMTADVPNAFIQTEMPDGHEVVIMKITGVLVDLLIEIDPNKFKSYVVYENGKKVIYVRVLRAIYGMIESSLLWYNKFRKTLEKKGFEFNPYDPCVANRKVHGKQHTVTFHVDDLKSSHVDPKVNDEFLKWLNRKFGLHGEVKAVRGKRHDYLGMTLDYSKEGKVIIDMKDYVANMVDGFGYKIEGTEPTPAAEDLLSAGTGEALDAKCAEMYHTTVAKGLFVCKRARPDIQPTIAVLCSRVKSPTQSEWDKLIRMLKYLNGTQKDVLTLGADSLHVIKWYVDSSFAVHPDFKSHTGGTMTMGQGAIMSMSRKQKLNTRSSTEAELVGADDASVLILWSKLFLEAQGYSIKKNILYQDNKSAILLETNGKRSSSKRTRALNIRYFFLTDQVEKGNLSIEYCPTGEMIGDFMTKPLQGAKFQYFRKLIMGM